MTVGWATEPAVAGYLNAVELILRRGDAPVREARIKVQVTFGDKTGRALQLVEAFDSPGEYHAAVVPTRPGTYTFHFTGTVGSQRFDQRFTSGPGTFDSPQNANDLEFPEKDPPRSELAQRVTQTDARAVAARSTADDAKGSAGLATILGAAGLLMGLAALVVALTRKKPPST